MNYTQEVNVNINATNCQSQQSSNCSQVIDAESSTKSQTSDLNEQVILDDDLNENKEVCVLC